jgi:ABC-2 type transport system permease protein
LPTPPPPASDCPDSRSPSRAHKAGGTWFPITGGGGFQQFCELLPSFWLVRAGQVRLGGSGNPWGTEGWVVLAAWSVVCAAFAVWAFRRDTKRA